MNALRKKLSFILVVGVFLAFLNTGCLDDSFFRRDDAKLVFSSDTVMFDTIFTEIGSTTKSFRVINPYAQAVLISSIELAGGDASEYRLNIDGVMDNKQNDIELPPFDSIYIFVEITIDPNEASQPMVVQDSIIFKINKAEQDVDLMAWGQNFVPYRENEIIGTTTWTADKPYLVMDTVVVDTNAVLTIEPGARIFFHKDAMLAGIGNIHARGTTEEPIIFKGHRLEHLYDDVPDQWHGILLLPNEGENIFENVEIKGGKIGIQAGAIEIEGPSNLQLHNVKIQHMSYAGLFALKANVEASNTVIADCKNYAAALLYGGSYNFNHCTVANYWNWGSTSNRESASVTISNVVAVWSPEANANVLIGNDLTQATWTNSIIWGSLNNEIEFIKSNEYNYRAVIENCIYRLGDSIYDANKSSFFNAVRNENPLFKAYPEYNFELDTLSPAKDAGAFEFGGLVPLDLNNVSRLDDLAPDLGAYERVE